MFAYSSVIIFHQERIISRLIPDWSPSQPLLGSSRNAPPTNNGCEGGYIQTGGRVEKCFDVYAYIFQQSLNCILHNSNLFSSREKILIIADRLIFLSDPKFWLKLITNARNKVTLFVTLTCTSLCFLKWQIKGIFRRGPVLWKACWCSAW